MRTGIEARADTLTAELLGPEGHRDPYPLYSALHRLGPACALTPGVTPYAAVVHGYEAVDRALRDPNLLVTHAAQVERGRPDWRDHPTLLTLLSSLMFTNAPGHGRMRRMFQQVFSPRRVESMAPEVDRVLSVLLDRMAAHGAGGAEVDFMADFAYPVPSGVVGALLGVPDDDLAWFRPRAQAINDHMDSGGNAPDLLAAADRAAAELSGYYRDMMAQRRANPRDDLVTNLVQALDAGEHDVSEADVVSNLVVVFNAGFVTTINLLGNGLPLVLERPALAAGLRDDPALASRCVEEILRYDTSVQLVTRWAADDGDVAGVPLAAGEGVLVLIGAANRDPHRFADPDSFDVDRADNAPISFGAGPHYCLGAALARLEGRLAFSALLGRFPRLARASAPTRNTQLLLRGYEVLPVTVE